MSEIQVRLPDGKLLAVPAGSTVLAVAERIGKGLARAALAGRIDGRLVDLRAAARTATCRSRSSRQAIPTAAR